MKFISIVALLAAPFAVSATRIGWAAYDNGEQSLNTVACSDGPNGLVTRGYSVFKDLPTFPNISGSSMVTWNSPLCGSCWNVTYNGETVTVTVIDNAGDGVNLSKEAMNSITDGRAEALGSVNGTSVQVPNSLCGMPN